jgi:hypothetical protein
MRARILHFLTLFFSDGNERRFDGQRGENERMGFGAWVQKKNPIEALQRLMGLGLANHLIPQRFLTESIAQTPLNLCGRPDKRSCNSGP